MKLKSTLVILPLVMTLSACSKLTQDNYEKLEVGMKRDEIKVIIGAADSCSKSMATLTCTWGNEEGKHIKVRFMADTAVTFSNSGL